MEVVLLDHCQGDQNNFCLSSLFGWGLAPILDELTSCSHLGDCFSISPILGVNGRLVHFATLLEYGYEQVDRGRCSVLPLLIWVWLVISGPYPQLKTVVLPGLIFEWGRAYVTGIRMEWLRKRNLRTAILLFIHLLLFFYSLRRPFTCGFDPLL